MIKCRDTREFLRIWGETELPEHHQIDKVLEHLRNCTECGARYRTLMYLLERESGQKHEWHKKIQCLSLDLRDEVLKRIEESELSEKKLDSTELDFTSA